MTPEGLSLEVASRITRTEFEKAVVGNSAPRPGDVLFSKDGTVGKVHVVTERIEFAVLSSIAILRPRPEKLDGGFLGQVLRSPTVLRRAANSKTGSALTRIVLKDLKRVAIPLPPLAEQRRIAAILDKADAVRRKWRRSLRLLDGFRRSAFLEIFGDPARNEKGWVLGRIGDFVVQAQYGTSTRANTEQRGLPVLRMNNLTQTGDIDLTDLKWCEIRPQDMEKYIVRRGDLLFNRTNSPELVGKTAVWDRNEPFAFAGYLIRARVDKARVLPEYMSGYLNSRYGKRLLFEKAKPSINMSNISATELKRLPIPLPPLSVQRHYCGVLGTAKLAAERFLSASSDSNDLFDSLAQRAFGGELWTIAE
jgi:type I restriction enzyme S subunit